MVTGLSFDKHKKSFYIQILKPRPKNKRRPFRIRVSCSGAEGRNGPGGVKWSGFERGVRRGAVGLLYTWWEWGFGNINKNQDMEVF